MHYGRWRGKRQKMPVDRPSTEADRVTSTSPWLSTYPSRRQPAVRTMFRPVHGIPSIIPVVPTPSPVWSRTASSGCSGLGKTVFARCERTPALRRCRTCSFHPRFRLPDISEHPSEEFLGRSHGVQALVAIVPTGSSSLPPELPLACPSVERNVGDLCDNEPPRSPGWARMCTASPRTEATNRSTSRREQATTSVADVKERRSV
jgi:hypothetical protein